MKILRKNYFITAYFIISVIILIGVLLYQNVYEWVHVGFIPYLFIAPGILFYTYQRTDRFGKALAVSSTLILFFLPLLAIWADGRNAGNVLGGLFPYNDATAYYIDGLGLLDGRLLSHISVRRPIFTVFLSLLFLITGRNLQLTLVILVLINAVICHFLARRVQQQWGTAAAVMVIVLVFFFYRRFTGTTLTESLGLALGMAGFALLLSGIEKKNRKAILFGILVLTLGMNVRPGALLVLPLITLWAGWHFRENSRFSVSFFAISILAVALGFFVNWGTGRLVVDPEITAARTGMFSNYSYSFYGLTAGGEGWRYIYQDHPELLGVDGREALVYSYAFRSIRQNPLLFLKGISRSFLDFFSPRDGAFSFIYASTSTPCLMEDFTGSLSACRNRQRSTGISAFLACLLSTFSIRIADILASLVLALLLLVPFIWGMIISYKNQDQPWGPLFLAMSIGILLSAPLVPLRDASKMRVYAVTQPILITVAAVGFLDLLQKFSKKYRPFSFLIPVQPHHEQQYQASSLGLVIISIILTLGIVLSPLIARLSTDPPDTISRVCPSHLEELHLRFNPGSSITLVQPGSASTHWAGLKIPVDRFSRNLDAFCAFYPWESEMIDELRLVKPGDVLIAPPFLDSEGNFMLLVMPSEPLPAQASWMTVCGEQINNIFYVETITQ
jgi:hypothetical protein